MQRVAEGNVGLCATELGCQCLARLKQGRTRKPWMRQIVVLSADHEKDSDGFPKRPTHSKQTSGTNAPQSLRQHDAANDFGTRQP
jgi:hypothetical protein